MRNMQIGCWSLTATAWPCAMLLGCTLPLGCQPQEQSSEPEPALQLQQALVNSVQIRVSASADDAEESSGGSVSLTSTDLELVNDGNNQRVGIRFRNLPVPRGSTILSAGIDFSVDETGQGATQLSIRAEASNSASPFTTASNNVSSRPLTSAAISWAPAAWSVEGQTQSSPDLASLVQEVVGRGGWNAGGHLAFVITGTGRRTAEAYDGVPASAPLLKLSYEPPPSCGDLTCNGAETCGSCAQDCGECSPPPPPPPPPPPTTTQPPSPPPPAEPSCGDAACNGSETCSTCAPDCGACPITSVTEVRIASSADDAEESSAGAMSLTSTDVELVSDGNRGNQRVGLRFAGLQIPRGVVVTQAHVVFVTDEVKTATAQVNIAAHASDNAPAFTSANNNVSSRVLTSARAPWTPPAWSSVGQAVQTPSLSALVQEVINRPAWQPGNALALVITGSGTRTATAFDGNASRAALLHVEYLGEPPPAAVCGNGSCDGGESCSTCPSDCGTHAAPGVTRFAVVGDFGMDNAAEAAVATLVGCWNPEFVVTTGDNNYPAGAQGSADHTIGQYYSSFIGNYQGNYGPGSATNRFWPTLGNHDWDATGAAPYLNYFSMPGGERYYDADLGLVHLYSVDSDPHEPDGTTPTSIQGVWLQERLAQSTSCWDIVFFHHAAYVSGVRHGSNIGMRWPFEAWGADAVLTGHEHLYERLHVGNIPYFVNGIGGADLYPFAASPLPESVVRYNNGFGAMLVEARVDSIDYSLYSTDGVRRDQFTSTKSCP